MNRIYKVIWSKVKHQYVVVSELAHRDGKRSKSIVCSTAALLAVFALTAGVGVAPVWAVNTADATTELIDSNYSAYLDEENTITNSEDTYVVGNGNIIDNFVKGMVIGNGNELSSKLSSNGSDNLIIGNDNAGSGQVLNNSIVLGSHNVWKAAASGNIFIGNNINLKGSNTVVVGHDVTADQMVSALGDKITASWGASVMGYQASSESNSVSIGHLANADAAQTVAIGYGAVSHSGYGAAIGAFAEVGSKSYGLALGGYSRVGNNAMKSIAIGTSGRGYTEGRTEVKDGASYSIAMGGKTTVGENATQSVAIGGYSASVGDGATQGTAVGTWAHVAADVEEGAALGYNAGANANYGTALGSQSKANGENSTSAGYNSSANGEWSTALGASTDANHQATAVGSNAQALAGNSVAVGVNSSVAEGADYSVALGTSSKVEEGDAFTTTDLEDFKKKLGDTYNAAWNITSADGTLGVVSVGAKGKERRLVNVARGRIDADSTDAVNGSQLYGLASDLNQKIEKAGGDWTLTTNGGPNDAEKTTVGKGDVVDFSSATKTVTRGQETEEHKNITISQDNTDLTFTLNDDLYLGNVNEGTGAYVNVLGSTGQILLGKDATNFINIDGDSRTISGLSNLTWDPMNQKQYDGSSLAATESQLHDAFGYLNDKIDNIDVNISGDDNVNVGKNEGAGSGTGTGESTGSGSADAPKFDFDISMSDTPQFGGHTDDDKGHAANGSVTIVGTGADGTSHKVVIDGATGLASGLSNTDWDWNKYEEGGYQTSNAATESQLHGAMEGTVQYDRDENGNVDKTNVTLNKGGDSVTIHNVAAGTADTDAVNVSQLNQAWDQINNNTTAITNIGNKVGELDSRIDEVGAGAAALAALHPLDFDPDDKWDFAAGYGNYRGENAVAIGAFYRPNEDTMFSVGGTVGNGDNMVNAGVSFKLGQGNNVSTSRVAMAKEIKSMRDIVAKQDAQIQKLTAMVNALVGMEAIAPDTTTMFPDVPENHWAYEAVETMAKTGLVKGYPDGEFKGDRNMTRYEFAQIVYNAIQAGIKVDERLVQEFRPELEYFRIDTISKDKDGNPVIQRVRANEIPATK